MYYIMPLALLYGETPTASDLIQGYKISKQKVTSISYSYTLHSKQNDSAFSSPIVEKHEVEFKTDGNRVDHRAKVWSNHHDRDHPEVIKTVPVRERSFMWDGQSLYLYRTNALSPGGELFIEPDDKEKPAYMACDNRGSPLQGIFSGDFERVDSILEKSDVVKVSDRKEKVGNYSCYVISAEGKYGKYKIWIDPEHGYNIAKAKVSKKRADIAWRDMPLGPRMDKETSMTNEILVKSGHPGAKKSLSFTLYNVKFENVDGAWLAVKADFQGKLTAVNGRTVELKTSVERKNIQINPTFGENDFKPDNIADGTRVSIIPFQIQYTWQNGKVVDGQGREVDIKAAIPKKAESLLGKALPELKGFGLKVDPKETKGRKIVVCFWDMQQRPSRHCVHRLNRKAGLLGGKGVYAVLVEAGGVDEAALEEFVGQRKIELPVGRISGKTDDVLRDWSVRSLPWLILTDVNHVVTAEGFGIGELEEKTKKSGGNKEKN